MQERRLVVYHAKDSQTCEKENNTAKEEANDIKKEAKETLIIHTGGDDTRLNPEESEGSTFGVYPNVGSPKNIIALLR